MNIQEIRQQYPQYNDLSDTELADGFHSKFYSDIPKEQFYSQLGFQPAQQQEHPLANVRGMFPALEAGAAMVSGAPAMTTGLLGRAYAAATGVTDEAEKQRLASATTPKLFEAMAYEPRSIAGKELTEGIGDIASKAGRSMGAAFESAAKGGGQSLAQQYVEKKQPSLAADITELASDATIIGTPLKAGIGRFKSVKEAKALESRKALLEAAEAEMGKPIEQASTESLNTSIFDQDHPIAGRITQEDVVGKQVEQPLPTLPNEVDVLASRYPQGMDIGTIEAGDKVADTRPLPSLDNINAGTKSILELQETPTTRVPDTERLATRHDVPTIDFPLRQEVLQTPEISSAIDAFREQAAELSKVAENAISTDVRNRAAMKLADLQNEFAAGMRELGIDKPQDAIGLSPLYESGKPTKLPIKHGFSNKQRGVVNPSVFIDGFKKTKELVERGIKFVAEYSKSKNGLVVSALDSSGKNIGGAVFAPTKDGKSISARGTLINSEHQRKGIASEMYKFVEELGNDVVPSTDQTAAGKAFWESKPLGQTPFGKGQRGSVNLGSKPPKFEDYRKKLEQDVGRTVDDAVARKMYEKEHPTKSQQVLAQKAISKIVPDAGRKYMSENIDDIPGTVAKMAEQGDKDLDKPVGKVFRNAASAGSLQAWALPDNPVVHRGVGFITSVKDSYRIKTANMLSETNKAFNFFESKFSATHGINWKAAAQVLDIRRKNEFNASFQPSMEFKGKQLELWYAVDKAITETGDAVYSRMQELFPNRKIAPKLPYYFTSFFRGDWQIPVFGEKGNFLFNLREDSKAGAMAAADHMRKEGIEVGEPSVRKLSTKRGQKLDNRTDFEEMLDVLSNDDPTVQNVLTRMMASTERAAMQTKDMPSRFKDKSGRVGSLGDRPWRSDKQNYYDNKKALEMYIEGANDWLANTQISKFAETMNSDKAITAKNAKSFVNDYADYVTGNKEALIASADSLRTGLVEGMSKVPLVGKYIADSSAWKTAARTLANFNTALYTGYFSTRMVAQNVVQPIPTVLPKMAELISIDGIQGNPIQASLVGITKGLLDFAQMVVPTGLKDSRGIQYKRANHIVDTHLVETSRMFDGYWKNQVYDKVANLSVVLSEQFSRNIAFSMYREFFESAGYDTASAMDAAKNLTHNTMGNYEQHAKAQMFGRAGIAGELSGRLQTYKVSAATQHLNYIMKMKKDSPKTWIPAMVDLNMMLVTAGAMGIVGMDVVESIWQAVQAADRMGKPTPWIQENSPKRFLYDHLPERASVGALSVATGANLSGAMTQNLLGDDAFKSLFPIYSGIGEQVAAPFRAMSDNDVTKARGLNAFTPASVKPAVEHEFLTTTKNGVTQVVSPFTGKETYRGKDRGYIGHSNLQTMDRARQSFANRFHKEYKQDVGEAKKNIEEGAKLFAWNLYKQELSKEEVGTKLQEITKSYVDVGGDPEQLINQINKQVETYASGSPLQQELSKAPTLSTRKEYGDALKRFQRSK